MKTHKLKIYPMYLKAILDGSKTWECRENDRNFQISDELLLQEWDAGYTGKELLVKITYLFKGRDMVLMIITVL